MKEKCPCGADAVWMKHPAEEPLENESIYTCMEHLKASDGDLFEYSSQGFTKQDYNPGIMNDITTFL